MTPTVEGSTAAIYNGSGFAAGFSLSSSTASTSSRVVTTTTATGATTTVTESGTQACTIAGGASDSTTCPNLEASSNKSDTTKVGLGVGIGIGVPLLAALAAVLFLWSREKKRNREYQQQAASAGPQAPWGKSSLGYGAGNGMQGIPQGYHEVPGQMGDYGAAQMMGGDGRKELPTIPMTRN
ncbi:MAG: hypothetical protein Q9195_004376 [Heterodermia aff. obscurata]